MKKFFALFLIICLVTEYGPIVNAQAKVAEQEQVVLSDFEQDDSEEYFVPIVVEEDQVLQGTEHVDYVEEDGEIFVDAESLACDVIDGNVVEQATCVEDEGITYVSIDDVADQCNMEVICEEDATIYVKPFQTKRLFVELAGELPDVDAVCVTYHEEEIILEFETEEETEKAYDLLQTDHDVLQVTGENVYHTYATVEEEFSEGEHLSWGAEYVNSTQVVKYAEDRGDMDEVVVAVVDTGICTTHPLFEGRLHSASSGINTASVEDGNGHGSHVAGIIVDNTSSNVSIMAVKGLSDAGSATDGRLAKAIDYAVQNGADIINMSWGGYYFWTENVLIDAIENAYNAGVILVAAAGNESDNASYYFPARSSYCITVAASDEKGAYTRFSNYGGVVDVAAPGVSIYSSYKNNEYATLSGTSMASPYVAAACAMDISLNGTREPAEIGQTIKKNVTPFSNGKDGRGKGIVDFTPLAGPNVFTSEVIFSVEPGKYENAFQLELKSADENAQIYYTIDSLNGTENSDPTREKGILYDGPIAINKNLTIRARAYCAGKQRSRLARASYRFDFYDGMNTYIVDENGRLTSYQGEYEELSIPEEVNGITVTCIGTETFKEKTLKNITLPDTVTRIEEGAFYKCRGLESVIGHGVQVIEKEAFYGINSLVNVEMESLTEVGEKCFYGSNNLSEKGMQLEHLKVIGSYAFCDTGFTVFEGPNVEIVGEYAFKSCFDLQIIYLPKVYEIGDYAFAYIYNLETITIPDMEEIPTGLFQGSSLKEIPSGVKNAKVISKEAFLQTDLETIDFPEAWYIGENAFERCYRVQTVNLPKVTYFERHSNGTGSDDLIQLELPEVLYFGGIGEPKLKELHLPKCVFLGNLWGSCDLEYVYAPHATDFSDFSIMYCTSLKELILPYCQTFSSHTAHDGDMELLYLPNATEVKLSEKPRLHHVILPNCVDIEFYLKNLDDTLEMNLPKAKKIIGSRDSARKTYKMDLNIHAPILEEYKVDSFYSDIALPQTAKVTGQNKDEFVIYANRETVSVDDKVTNYQIRVAPEIKEDLPDVFEVTDNYFVLETSVYCANPTYEWYFSADGIDYKVVEYNRRNKIIPERAGYYYCKVIDNETQKGICTSVCEVNINTDVVPITFAEDREFVVLVGDFLFENVGRDECIYVPKGTEVTILYDGTFDKILVNNVETKETLCKFTFAIDEDTAITLPEEKRITSSAVALKGCVYNLDGSVTPVCEVSYDGKRLVQDKDYMLQYTNTERGTKGYYYLCGIGEYAGIVTGTYHVSKTSLFEMKVELKGDSIFEYNRKEHCPKVEIAGLKEGVDYTLEYVDNIFPGTGYVIVHGGGKYYGTKRLEIQICKKIINADECVLLGEYFDIGKPITPIVEWGSYLEGEDFLVQYEDDVNAKTRQVLVRGINHCEGEIKLTLVKKSPYPSSACTIQMKKNSARKVTLAWDQVQNAEGYAVYGMDGGVKKTKSNKIVIDNLMWGKKYTFYVVAYRVINGKLYESGHSNYASISIAPKTPKIKKIKWSKEKLKVTWEKVKGADAYEIQISKSKKFAKTKTINETAGSKVKQKIILGLKKKLKKGKVYIRIRGYYNVKDDNNRKTRIYSDYSSVKKIQLK